MTTDVPVPNYVRMHESGTRRARRHRVGAPGVLRPVRPYCRVDRIAGKMGTCRTGVQARVSAGGRTMARARLRGRYGSGTIFFTRCTMRCVLPELRHQPTDNGRLSNPSSSPTSCWPSRAAPPQHQPAPHVVPRSWRRSTSRPDAASAYRWCTTPAGTNPEALALLDGVIDIYTPT